MKNARLVVAIVSSIAQVVVIVAILLWLLPRFDIQVPIWGIIVICVIFAVYAVTLYKIGSRTLVWKAIPGLTNMVGLKGQTMTRLAPEGYVRIQGELWEARSEEGVIPNRTKVVVVSQTGLKLIVRLIG